MLDVMMIMVFLKFTKRPLLSVKRPSSNTCSKMLNTSGWAFSISSSNITLYGLRRLRPRLTAHLHHNPHNPEARLLSATQHGVPGIQTYLSAPAPASSLNKNSANALASSVLPTPVVPRNINEPMGFVYPANQHGCGG
jgi:hypothetical protein